ncbi:hypothetical protein [Lancefieldella parvula]|nr:hypothetical protein [Lancefieldella parvula]
MHTLNTSQAKLARTSRAQKLLHRQATAALRTSIGLMVGALLIAIVH